jgi:hypothetical protein
MFLHGLVSGVVAGRSIDGAGQAAPINAVRSLPAGDDSLAGTKRLARDYDPVVVPASNFSTLPELSTVKLRLYRVDAGRGVPIPFQFDQRDRRGDIVVDGPTDFDLAPRDELVFMAKDTGDRATAGLWPADCDAVNEIEVTDPRSHTLGWAYLLHFRSTPPPPATERYVTFDPSATQARSASYEADYAPTRNFFSGLHVTERAGGDGTNLLRKTEMHGCPTFSLLLSTVTLEFTEQTSVVRIEGVKNGPVRAVRRVQLAVDLGRLFPDLPTGTVYTYHYENAFVTPTKVHIPWVMLKTLKDFRFEDVHDFAPHALPLRYWDGANPAGLTLADQAVHAETTQDHDWWVHSSKAGTMLHAFLIPEPWRRWGIVRGTVVRTDEAASAGDGAGFSLLNMTRLREAGTYDLVQASIVLPHPYQPGDEDEPMAMLRAPLEISVHRVR